MASDRNDPRPGPDHPRGGGGRSAAARRRSPRPRVEVTVNELTGTMSWRTIQPGGGGRRDGAYDRTAGTRSHSSASPADRREKAAALRAAGLDPAQVDSRGAAPIPTHPAAVRAAVSVSVETLTPDQLQHHLARVGALRSRLAGDAARGTRMPVRAAAQLRSTATPSRVHALTAERTSAVRELGNRTGPRAQPQAPRR
jgi:hypothetical protein